MLILSKREIPYRHFRHELKATLCQFIDLASQTRPVCLYIYIYSRENLDYPKHALLFLVTRRIEGDSNLWWRFFPEIV